MDDKVELAELRTDQAERRTEFAEDRTIQATERTFAGWIRTAFAALGIGIAFHVLFGRLQPPWLARAIATLFMLLAAGIAVTAERRAHAAFRRLKAHRIHAPSVPDLRWIGWSVAASAVLLIAAFWLLGDETLVR
jgi:putative membrane protein